MYYFLILTIKVFAFEGAHYSSFEVYNTSYEQLFPYTRSQKIHLLEVDQTKCSIRPARSLDEGLGRESALSLATRKGAIASVNGGFFSIGGTFDGLSRGALKIDEWVSLFDRLLVDVKGEMEGFSFTVDGLNTSKGNDVITLFTPIFHKTTMTNLEKEELVIRGGKVEAIHQGGGSYRCKRREDHLYFSYKKACKNCCWHPSERQLDFCCCG